MAKTPEDVIREQLGHLMMQLAVAQARISELEEAQKAKEKPANGSR